MSEDKTVEGADQATPDDSKAAETQKFPSPVPALHRASDQAARPGFRSASNKKTKAQKKKRKKKR
jgi:hypothetical protein